MANIAVLGAGIMGLSSAVALQKALPGVRITVIADQFTRETTSDGAGGLIVPKAVDTDAALNGKWGLESSRHFFRLAFSESSKDAGVYLSHGYELSTKPLTEPPSFLEFALSYRRLTNEISRFQPHYVDGYHFVTTIVEGRKYLPWLTARFEESGGICLKRKIEKFDELAGQYDIVVNCTGLGSRNLTGDKLLRPQRGQLLRVSAPWVKFFIHTDDKFYVLPSAENTAIGVTKQLDRSDVTPDPADRQQLWHKAVERLPALKGAKHLWDWVGIRPYRCPPRVEAELYRTSAGSNMKIVHNYGHGSFGISLSWGTAVHVAEMVQDLLQTKSKL